MTDIKTTSDPRGYPCPKCGQLFDTNPEEPPPPHTKPGSEDICWSIEEWKEEIENCP